MSPCPWPNTRCGEIGMRTIRASLTALPFLTVAAALPADATHDANALASKAPPAPKASAAATH
jgi:hypothetical protein